MTHHSFGQFLKWLIIAVVFIALWFGVSAVRKARAAVPGELHACAVQERRAPISAPSEDIRPVWVIVVFEVRSGEPIGLSEFVFSSPRLCQEEADRARKELGFKLKPVCYLRWMKADGGTKQGTGR